MCVFPVLLSVPCGSRADVAHSYWLRCTCTVRDGDVQGAERVRGVVERELRPEQRQEPGPDAQDRRPARPQHLRGALPPRERLLLRVSAIFSCRAV